VCVLTEVIYAVDSQKKIIPLIVEPRYKPHGWLKFHTSDGLRLDFSRIALFEVSFKKLLSQIMSSLESIPIRRDESTDETTDFSKNENIRKWTGIRECLHRVLIIQAHVMVF